MQCKNAAFALTALEHAVQAGADDGAPGFRNEIDQLRIAAHVTPEAADPGAGGNDDDGNGAGNGAPGMM